MPLRMPTIYGVLQYKLNSFYRRVHIAPSSSVKAQPKTTFVFLGVLKSKSHGPGVLQFRGGKCFHIYPGGLRKPVDGARLVIRHGCTEERLRFELRSDGKLMHTRHGMCVKPIGLLTEGVKVSLY